MFDPVALRHLIDLVGADRVCIGTDAPFDMADMHPADTIAAVPRLTAAERDQFASGLGELLERSGERHGDVSRVVMTKVGMFDLVGLRRLCEYHDVMGPPDFQLTFYLVAQQLLLHHGGKRYHPSVVAVITDFLSANYGILSKIVLSGLRAGDAPTSERDAPFDPLPCDPNLPDIADKQPSRIYSAGEHVLLLVENVDPIGARGAIKFRYVLVVCERQGRSPICFVTLENSPSTSNVLCVFEASGCHSNYGALRGRDVRQEFIDKGIRLIRERFDLGEIEELSTRREEASWWSFLPTAAGKATVVRAPAICAGIGAEVA